jgi:phenylacetate-CoA ligase
MDIFARVRSQLQRFSFYFLHLRSPQATRRWQAGLLRRVVRHSAANIPLYREILASANVSPDDIRTFDDISRLPVLSKKTFTGIFAEEYTNLNRPLSALWVQTSGTAGAPFTFAASGLYNNDRTSRFLRFKFMVWEGVPVRTLQAMRVAQIKIRSRSSSNKLFLAVRDFLQKPEEAVAALVSFEPMVIESYSAILLELAKVVEKKQSPLAPRYVVSFGEKLSPSSRVYIERTLKTKIFDRYGTEEMGVIGVECAQHDGFHINIESVIIEITDDAGNPLPPGSSGRVIGTDLMNYNMPFIRYDTSDHGVMTFDRCACGLRTPRIWIEGRYSAYLTFNERKIHHLEFDGALDGFMNHIFQYQVAKLDEHRLEVRIVPSTSSDTEKSTRAITEKLQDLVGPNITVTVLTASSVPIVGRGKSQIIVDESAVSV